MKKIFAVGLISLALGIPAAAPAGTGDFCIAADGGTCRIVAGPASDDIVADDGTILLSGRVGWIAVGEWSVVRYPNADCTGTPDRIWNSTDDQNLPEGIGGANNGGGYYEYCVEATAGDASVILIGARHTELLP